MIRNFASFIKFGSKQNMENLLYKGEIFCKELNYFIGLSEENLQGDKYDGCDFVKQGKDLKIKHNDKVIATAQSGQLYRRDVNKKGNLYCLYGIPSEQIDFDKKITKPLKVNTSSLRFAEYAILIFQPLEFLDRPKAEISKNDYYFEFAPIIYYNENIYEGEIDHFHKRKKYEDQNEVRFWISNSLSCDLKFNIGSIEDIAAIFPKDMMLKLECEPE